MAILESATLDVPLTGGLAEKVDRRVLPPGSYAVLENLVQDKAGAFKKRYGFGTVSGTPPENPAQVGAHSGQPWAVSTPSGATPEFSHYDGAGWRGRGAVEFGRTLFRREIVRPAGSSFFEALHRVPASPRPLMVALWVDSQSGTTAPLPGDKVFFRVLDAESGVERVAARQLFLSSERPFASCVVGTNVVVAQRNAVGSIVLTSINPATGLATVLATLSGGIVGTASLVDVCAYDATHFALAYSDGANTYIFIINAVTGVTATFTFVAGPANAILVSLAFLPGSPGTFWVFAKGAGAVQGFTATSTGPTNLTPGALTGLGPSTTITRIAPCAVDLPAALPGFGPACLVLLSSPFVGGVGMLTEVRLLDDNFGSNVLEVVPWAMPTAKPVQALGRLWVPMAAHAARVDVATGTVDAYTTCLASITIADEESAAVRLCAVLGRLRSKLSPFEALSLPQLSANASAQQFEVPSRIFVDVGRNVRFGADWSRVTANQYEAGSHQNCDCLGAVGFSGSHVAWYDGARVAELGFVNDPFLTSASQSAGTGSIAVGSYDFFACYEWTDDAGNLHRSAPSAPLRVDVAAPNTAVTLNVAVTGLTGKPVGEIVIHLFRTLAGPGPDVFRLTSNATAPRNDPNAATAQVQFVANLNDAAVLALGLGFLYTGAQVPARTPPGANAFLAHKGRAWIAVADERGQVAPSKPVVPGLAPEFSDEFIITLPQAIGPVTALAPLDDAVLAFTASQAFVIAGEGRASNGQGGDFAVVQIPTDHGCVNAASVVATEDGAFFQAARGICLAGRDQSIAYVGAPVETQVGSRVVRSAFVDQARRRVVWLVRGSAAQSASHVMPVFDLDMRLWTTWKVDAEALGGSTVTGSAMVAGRHWISTIEQGFGLEETFSSRDFGSVYVRSTVETPWLRVGALVGHQRTRRFALEFDRFDPFLLDVQVFVDLNDRVDPDAGFGPAQTFLFDLSTSTPVVDPSRARLVGVIAPQKHSTIKLKFVDRQAPGDTTSNGRGPDYASLALDVAGKKGLAKVAAGNRR